MPGARDKKLLALPLASPLTGAEALYVVQGGLDKRTTVADVSGGGGTGNVDGPVAAASSDNALVRWDGTSGRLIKDSPTSYFDGDFLFLTDNFAGGVGYRADNSETAGQGWASAGYCIHNNVQGEVFAYDSGGNIDPSVIGVKQGIHLQAYVGDAWVSVLRTGNPGSSIIHDGACDEKSVALIDGASVALDSCLGNIFTLFAAGDRTIQVPTNPPHQVSTVGIWTRKMIIRHTASGANRTLTLTTGSAGAFRFGSTISGLTATVSGKTDYIGALWNAVDLCWDVVAYAKGF